MGSEDTRRIVGRIISNSASCTCIVSGWLSKSNTGVAGPVLGEGDCISRDFLSFSGLPRIRRCDSDILDLTELDLRTDDVIE